MTSITAARLALAAASAGLLVAAARSRPSRAASPDDGAWDGNEKDDEEEGLIFTGTGCSSGLPLTACLLGGQAVRSDVCRACVVAARRGRSDKNWRNNVGVLLRFRDPATGTIRCVQIDCGKTFRETALTVYRQHGVTALDAVILTHDHADAVGGLDELRSLQRFDPKTYEIDQPIQCHCDRRTMTRLRHMFPYLFPVRPFAGLGGGAGGVGGDALCTGCGLDMEPLPQPPPGATPPPPSPPPAAPPEPAATGSTALTASTAAPAAPPSSDLWPRSIGAASAARSRRTRGVRR